MTENQQLEAFFADEGLSLPKIKSKAHPEGKTYIVASPNFETGLTLQELGSIAQRLSQGIEVPVEEAKKLKLNDDEEQTFAELVLGETLAEMRADEVGWVLIQRALSYAFTYFAMGPKPAERLVQSLAPKDVPPANRAARRKKPKKR